MRSIAYPYTILVDCVARRGKAFGGFQVTASLPREPCVFAFFFIFFVSSFWGCRSSRKFRPCRFRGGAFLCCYTGERKPAACRKTNNFLEDDANRGHAETHLEASNQWIVEGFTCTHGLLFRHRRLSLRFVSRTAWIQQIQFWRTRVYLVESIVHSNRFRGCFGGFGHQNARRKLDSNTEADN